MPLFKDFNKDVKDLLSKNYADKGAWKIESKFKGPDRTVFINPQADGKNVNVDVEYNIKEFGLKTKTNVDANLTIKPKVTYEKFGHKVELALTDLQALKYELTYEGAVGPALLFEKLTPEAINSTVAVVVVPGVFVGGGITYSLKTNQLSSWEAGVQYSKNNVVANVTTTSLEKYTIGGKIPLSLAGQNITVGAQVDVSKSKEATVTVGIEAGCVLCKANKIRARVRSTGAFAVSYIARFADNWTAAITYEYGASTVGVLLTRE